uniref:Uncharacterized protein n=1 Tax=Cacopsylla melanoneura TaxID=428564 RepID=A0A8D9BWC8_9HEMI
MHGALSNFGSFYFIFALLNLPICAYFTICSNLGRLNCMMPVIRTTLTFVRLKFILSNFFFFFLYCWAAMKNQIAEKYLKLCMHRIFKDTKKYMVYMGKGLYALILMRSLGC